MTGTRGRPAPVHRLLSLYAASELLVGKFQSGDLKFSAVIDTGATKSFVPSDGLIMAKLKLQTESTDINVQAGDNKWFNVSWQAFMHLRPAYIDQAPIRSRVLVVDHSTDLLGHSMVIGVTDIKELGLDIGSNYGILVAWKDGVEVAREERTISHSAATLKESECTKASESINDIVQHYLDVFSESITTRVRCEPARLDLMTQRHPRAKLKRFSPEDTISLKNLVDKFMKHGLIEASRSPCSANARFVPKKSGQMRLVVNYIPLNRLTVPFEFPVPRLEDLFLHLLDAKYFSLVDCTDGFYQIPLDPE